MDNRQKRPYNYSIVTELTHSSRCAMRTLLMSVLVSVTILLLSSSIAQSTTPSRLSIASGNWTFKTLITVSGIPGIPSRSLTFNDCLSPHHLVPSKIQNQCSRSPLAINGQSVSYTLTCTGSISRAHFTYSQNHMSGEIVTSLNGRNSPKVMEKISGRYSGACRRS